MAAGKKKTRVNDKTDRIATGKFAARKLKLANFSRRLALAYALKNRMRADRSIVGAAETLRRNSSARQSFRSRVRKVYKEYCLFRKYLLSSYERTNVVCVAVVTLLPYLSNFGFSSNDRTTLFKKSRPFLRFLCDELHGETLRKNKTQFVKFQLQPIHFLN